MSLKFTFHLEKQITIFTQEIEFNGTKRIETHCFHLTAISNGSGPLQFKGEVNLIPEMHGMTFDCTQAILEEILATLSKESISKSNIDFEKPLFNLYSKRLLELEKLPKHCLYGLENLLLPFLIGDKSEYIKQGLLNNKGLDINGLYIIGPKSNTKNLPEKMFHEKKYLKIKIGRITPSLEVDIINEIINKFPHLILRLDANRKLDQEQLNYYLENIDTRSIEYFEEPMISSIDTKLNYKLAIDETLEEVLKTNEFNHKICALVIKPSVKLSISGVIKLLKIIKNDKKIKIIISSCFESNYGMQGLYYLAHEANKHQATGHGLDTLKYIKSTQIQKL